jgi:3-phenylpropionate/cinnamic acid dioxygenase small subunit
LTSADTDTRLGRALLQWSVEQFYFNEASLLDEHRYNEWIALFSKNVRYWAPVRVTREGAPDVVRDNELSLFEDDYGSLELRVESFQVKSAWAEIPQSRTRHLISNVQVTSDSSNQVSAVSNFFVFRSRLESVEHLFVGRRRDRLERLGEDQWRICERMILFDHSSFMTDNISIMF